MMTKEVTLYFETAAKYTTLGAGVVGCVGSSMNTKVIVKTTPFQYLYIKFIGWLPINKYLNQRNRMKDLMRTHNGLPKRFTSKNKRFNRWPTK